MAAGTVTARRAAIHAAAWMAGRVVGPPRHRARSEPVMTVMGLAVAKACSQPGMVATGTRAELVKNKMMTGNRPASPADSGSRTARPSSRLSQENTRPVATANATAARAAAGPAWNRNPITAATPIISPVTNTRRTYQLTPAGRQRLAGDRAARAALADFGDLATVVGEFTRQSPGRRAARLLLATGPAVGACWGAALILSRAWTWPVPATARLSFGAALLLAVVLLVAAATSRRSYQRTRLTAV